jgi:hypothetical protein
MSRFNKLLVLCLVISSCIAVHARRRSRIDLPIKNAADAPLEDNVAEESGKEEAAALSAPQPTTVQPDVAESNDVSESNSSEELQDCDNIDNISFELITG